MHTQGEAKYQRHAIGILNDDLHQNTWCHKCLANVMQAVMRDPVLATDGHSYERSAIEQWFLKHDCSPLTNKVLDNKELQPNLLLKRMIQNVIEEAR